MTFWGRSGSGSGSADPCLWLMDLDADPDPAIFVIDLPKMTTKNKFFKKRFSVITFWRYIYIIEVKNSRNQGFSYFVCLMMDGSGSRVRTGSIYLTRGSGSGSRRPKNIWIRWIRIRIRNIGTYHGKCFSILDRNLNQQLFYYTLSGMLSIALQEQAPVHCYQPWPIPSVPYRYAIFLAAFTTSPIQEFVLFVCRIDPSRTLTWKPLIRSQTLAPYDLLIHYVPIPFQTIKKGISILAGLEPAIFWFVVRRVVHCATGPSWSSDRSLSLIYLVPLQAIKKMKSDLGRTRTCNLLIRSQTRCLWLIYLVLF